MNEGDQITANELIENWKSILGFYDKLISNGFNLRPIRFLVKHIVNQEYSKKLFAGTSMYNLLISLPNNGKIDYTKTLQVNYDELTQIVKFNYHDKPRNKRTKENRAWSTECQATEVCDTFEFFINENVDWKTYIK